MYWLKDYEFCYMGRDMVNICLGILRTYNLVVIDLIKSDAHSLRKYEIFRFFTMTTKSTIIKEQVK